MKNNKLMIRLFYPYNLCLSFFIAAVASFVLFSITSGLLAVLAFATFGYSTFMYFLGLVVWHEERQAKLRSLSNKVKQENKAKEGNQLQEQLIGQILIKTNQYSVGNLKNKSLRELEHMVRQL